jgi:hypothetical protein
MRGATRLSHAPRRPTLRAPRRPTLHRAIGEEPTTVDEEGDEPPPRLRAKSSQLVVLAESAAEAIAEAGANGGEGARATTKAGGMPKAHMEAEAEAEIGADAECRASALHARSSYRAPTDASSSKLEAEQEAEVHLESHVEQQQYKGTATAAAQTKRTGWQRRPSQAYSAEGGERRLVARRSDAGLQSSYI